MALHPTRSARRIAEPALFAAIAAVLHLVDLLVAAGMLGSLLCPLPHALVTLRHGTRTGFLCAFSAVFAVLFLGAPPEALFHLFLFALPGMMVGRALMPAGDRVRSFAEGAAVSALGLAAVFYLLGQVLGLEEAAIPVPSALLTAQDWLAKPFRWAARGHAWVEYVPGLASDATRRAWVESVLRLPAGFFVFFGAVWFFSFWFVGALVGLRLDLPVTPPPFPRTPRFPPALLPLLGLGLASPLVAGGPWVRSLLDNLCFALLGLAYGVGYLKLLRWGRGRPLRGPVVLLLAVPGYYLTIWLGITTALGSPGEGEPTPLGPGPGPGPGGPWPAPVGPPRVPTRRRSRRR